MFWLVIVSKPIYNIEIENPYDTFKYNLLHFALPFIIGLIIQKLFPDLKKCSMIFLQFLSPIAIFYSVFVELSYELDLYINGLFNCKVCKPNLNYHIH